MSRPLLLAVDAGGTRTRVALVAPSGDVVARVETAAVPVSRHGADAACDRLAEALARARADASLADVPPRVAVLGMAGVGDGRLRAEVERAALARGFAAKADDLHVVTDLRIALEGGLAGGAGLVVVAGTGSACYGKVGDRESRAGGWGNLLDDPGSAFDVARRGLMAAIHATDGRGPATRLGQAICAHLDLASLRELLAHLGPAPAPADVAALAPVVTSLAAAGDAVARLVLDDAAAALARCARAVADALELSSPEVTFAGGLALSSEYRDVLSGAVLATLPGARVVPPVMPPLLGAARLALEKLAGAVAPDVLERLRRA